MAKPFRLCAVLLVAATSLHAPPAAGAATSPSRAATARSKPIPSVRTVRPMRIAVGAILTIRGHNFLAGKGKNTVVLQRTGKKAIFVRAGIGTRKLVRVQLPDRLEGALRVRRGLKVPTRFRLRILSARFGKGYTSTARSPLISPKPIPAPPRPAAPAPPPDIDCDLDGLVNSKDADDDGDLLSDAEELAINAQQSLKPDVDLDMDPCSRDSDGDAISDGYEFRSAQDLNASNNLPSPRKRPYANPLDRADSGVDFDGDGLSLRSEYRLWTYVLARTGAVPSLDALSYSDGTQHSIYARDGAGRRVPALGATGYDRQQDFRAWLAATGYGTVAIPGDTPRPLLDVNRSGTVSSTPEGGQPTSEDKYYDMDSNGVLSDDERDEDADGLTNVEEAHGADLRFRLDAGYWTSLHPAEKPFKIVYEGTELDDPDTDGDGIRDGADDQDFDDYPNLMELSRQMATGRALDARDALPVSAVSTPTWGRINPFNPCLPDPNSRTCPIYVPFESAWAPFDDSPDYFVFN